MRSLPRSSSHDCDNVIVLFISDHGDIMHFFHSDESVRELEMHDVLMHSLMITSVFDI